ncbi:MAG TPA: DUF177 domain-containing protein [Tissierellaceae bacterium]
MKIDLSSFLDNSDEALYFEGEVSLKGLDLKDGITIEEPVKCKGEIYKVDGNKVINLKISYKYNDICDRCLKPTTKNVETTLFGKLVEGKKEEDAEEEGFDEVIFYQNNSLDLKEYIRKQVILSLPMKTLCKEDCKGLCPVCGADLNTTQCNCIHENIDPRLEKLREFLSKN